MPPLFSHQRMVRMIIAVGILIGLAALAFLPAISTGFPALTGGCFFYQMTGLPCPLCGGTRAASALMHGNLARAMHLNPLALPAVAGLFILAIVLGWEAFIGRPLTDWAAVFKKFAPLLPIAFLALFLWWFPHLWGALRGSKTELLDLRNPIARALYEDFRKQTH